MQATLAHRATRLAGEQRAAGVSRSRSRPHALRSSRESPACSANITYVLASAVPMGDIAVAVAASLFGPLIAAASVALYLLLASDRATLAGQMAAVANVVAAGLVTAMVLVQLSVNDVQEELSPEVNEAFEHVEFGLDVAWDVFLVAGMIFRLRDDRGPPVRSMVRSCGDHRRNRAVRAQLRDVPDTASLRRTRRSRPTRWPLVCRGLDSGVTP